MALCHEPTLTDMRPFGRRRFPLLSLTSVHPASSDMRVQLGRDHCSHFKGEEAEAHRPWALRNPCAGPSLLMFPPCLMSPGMASLLHHEGRAGSPALTRPCSQLGTISLQPHPLLPCPAPAPQACAPHGTQRLRAAWMQAHRFWVHPIPRHPRPPLPAGFAGTWLGWQLN